VLTEKQLPSNKGLGQLRLCALKLTLLAERNARPQAAQPHPDVEQTATAHCLPVLIAKATLMIIIRSFRRTHAGTPAWDKTSANTVTAGKADINR
jgi:hypothetical protein